MYAVSSVSLYTLIYNQNIIIKKEMKPVAHMYVTHGAPTGLPISTYEKKAN